jgi:RNA polymerase sigma-70 factor (ECF subfamily)
VTDVDPAFAAVVEQARAAWPELRLTASELVAHVARHAASQPDREAYLASVHAADLYLACAALRGDKAALAAFDEQYIARVGEYVVRVTVDRDVIDEVRQRLRERLLLGDTPKLASYAGTGPLGGWLRISAVREALNLVSMTRPSDSKDHDAPDTALDPELAMAKAGAHEVFRAAFMQVMSELGSKERTLLRLHYIERVTLDGLSTMFKTPRSTIARRVDDVRKAVLDRTKEKLRADHRLSTSEVASVFRQLDSQFHVTITKILN